MPTSTSEPLDVRLKAQARAEGFDACGIADASAPWDAGDRLLAFIGDGMHGTMDWMAATAERRSHPTAMWPDARSAVMLGINYGPATDPMVLLAERDRAAISVYAQGDDYHEVIKPRLKRLAGWLQRATGADVKVFVDTAPLMEKPLAARAGIGWQGKHTNLVSRTHGSWLFLGAILTTAALTPDRPEEDHCGSCRACLDICPTDAFPAPYRLDARRCLAYLSIEHAGPIPRAFRAAMGNRVYGCDDCLAVCPWNKFAAAAREVRLAARPALDGPALADLAALDDGAFRALFARTAVKRIGRDRFIRNVAIALGNSGNPEMTGSALRLTRDPSPIVRGAAVWALARLVPAARFAEEARRALTTETDPGVREEWETGA